MQLDTPDHLSVTTRTLHWIVALSMIGLLSLGVYMVETDTKSLYSWHKSFGVLIIIFVVLRIIWRIKNGWPTAAGRYSQVEHFLAKLVHWTLILGTLVMPMSGALMSSFGGHGVKVFGLEIVAKNIDVATSKVIAHSESLAGLFHSIHHWAGYIIIIALLLHIVGAFKHHIVDKDTTLNRMIGR